MSIEINNESGVAVDEAALSLLARHVLDHMQINPLAELSIVLLDPGAMAALHEQWMDLPGPTDVMAFPMDGEDTRLASGSDRGERIGPPSTDDGPGEALLGDVVLCPDVAAKQAAAAGHSVESELHLLCTHGILHLLGYDHGEPAEEQEMFTLQADILQGWVEASGREPIRAPLPGTSGEVRDSPRGARRG